MIFSKSEDYLCYVEAVHLLQHEGIKRECAFIKDDNVYKRDASDLKIKDDYFLVKTERAKELFFVIDNTDYPEAVLDENWLPRNDIGDESLIKLLDVEIKTTFTSNNKYYLWTVMFIIILGVLGGLLLLSFLCYCRQTYVFNRYTNERRAIKLEFLKIKDTEYTNFLLRESENLKRQSSNLKYRGGINSSMADEEDLEDEDSN